MKKTPHDIIMNQFFSLDNLKKLCQNMELFHREFLPVLAKHHTSSKLVNFYFTTAEHQIKWNITYEAIMLYYAEHLANIYAENPMQFEKNIELTFFIYSYYFDYIATKRAT